MVFVSSFPQEYDVFGTEADYRGSGKEPFHQSMTAAGFDHLLFAEQDKSRSEPSGLGLFFKKDVFDLEGVTGAMQLDCCSSLNDAAYNVDLLEKWHRCPQSPNEPLSAEEMAPADRRNAGFARLRHRSTQQVVWVAVVHLMTTSRDGPKTNEFPGEVRAGEMAKIRETVASFVSPDEAFILAGDFNTEAKDTYVFEGQLKGQSSGRMLEVQTGMVTIPGEGEVQLSRRFQWQRQGAQNMELREAFESRHLWGSGVGPAEKGGVCTSMNAERTAWIDYIWYSHSLLRPVALSDVCAPSQPIPDRDHGSDHLPVMARFEFLV